MRVWARFAIAAIAGCAGALACSSATTALGIVPTTGITIQASSLTTGAGCGTGPGQVYKYAAVLTDPHIGGVYDCFADAAFVNLPATANDGGVYSLRVYLYDKAAYDANAANIGGAVGSSNATDVLSQIPATWTTSCTATQTFNIQTVAECQPRSAGGPGSMVIATDSFALGDGGSIACNAGFSWVSAIVDDGGAVSDAGGTGLLPCPTPISLGPFAPLSQASADVTLHGGFGAVGTTTCRATIVPSAASPATCDPVKP